jgi:hypothetical protein
MVFCAASSTPNKEELMNLGSHDQDEPTGAGEQGLVSIMLNNLTFRVGGSAITGAAVRALPTPPVDPDYDLFRVDTGGADLLVRDLEVIEVEDGDRFFTVPRLILAGYRQDATHLNDCR